MTKYYRYKPLRGPQEIRLFAFRRSNKARWSGLLGNSLSTSTAAEQIEGTLRTIRLNDVPRPSYIALSYTWGNPFPETFPISSSKPCEFYIVCHGKRLKVQKNLHDALHVLRNTTHSDSWLWIDALCIDQANGIERNKQVSIMGNVYAEAAGVLVWLGPHDDASRTALPLMRQINRTILDISYQQLPRGKFRFSDPEVFSLVGIEVFTDSNWQAIADFFSRTWFCRLWVAQEIALSRRTAFLCGDSIGALGTLIRFVDWLNILRWGEAGDRLEEMGGSGPLPSGLRCFFGLIQMVHQYRLSIDAEFWGKYSKRDSISDIPEASTRVEFACGVLGLIITSSQHRLCSDPRDRVYAPLAMARRLVKDEDDEHMILSPDYSKSVETVFIDAAGYLATHSLQLDLLSYVDRQDSQTMRLPSWVPDFSRARRNSSLRFWGHDATKYWASPAEYNVKDRVLELRGILYDESLAVARIFEREANVIALLNLIHGLETKNYLDQSPLDVAMRTLLQDSFHETWEPANNIGQGQQIVPYEIVAESFRHWIKLHLILQLSRASGSPSIADLPPHILEICGTSPLFPSLCELESCREIWIKVTNSAAGTYSSLESPVTEVHRIFHRMIARCAVNRALIRTQRGNLGLGSSLAREGDQVWFLHGATVPFLLRKLQNGNYELVGEIYVHGFMQGEIFTVGGMSTEDAQKIMIE